MEWSVYFFLTLVTFQDFKSLYPRSWGFPDASAIKNPSVVQETQETRV